SGKSTIVRLLLKELEPTRGRIVVGGRDLTRLKRSKVPLLRRNVGCVFQDFKLLPMRTAAENVAYALKVQGESATSIRRKVPEVMNMVGLAHKMNSLPDELSGGEQQRVSIARAFVNHPPLLVCDEPTGNLDPDTCAKEASARQMNTVANLASQSPLVRKVTPVSKAQALAEMRKKHPEEVAQLFTNPFPNALTVIPKRGDDVEKVAALFRADPTLGIDKVDYGKKTTHKVLRLAHVIEGFFVVAVLLLLAASTLLIANTI